MQYPRFFVYFTLLVAGILVLNTDVLSYDHPRSNIRFSLGVCDMPDSETGITVYHTDMGDGEQFTDVTASGMSSAISFSSMVCERFAWEVSMGGFSDVRSKTLSKKIGTICDGDCYEIISSNTRVVSVSYVMAGLIYYPLYELEDTIGGLGSFFRPYLTVGIGPYFGWSGRWDSDSVTDANFVTAVGAYPGAGVDLLLSRHFILNIDLRYHLVEFGEPLQEVEDYSGLNAVAGFKVAF